VLGISSKRSLERGYDHEATEFLADRLARLVSSGILSKQRNPADRRREFYALTDAGLALIPVLVELANWGVRNDPEVTENPLWTSKVEADRPGLYKLIRDTVGNGGSVWRGDGSVIEQLQRVSRP
jgi:HxlR-like helix-turn-helix